MKNVIVKKSSINKKGVFANRDFKKGEIVIFWNPLKVFKENDLKKLNEDEKHYIDQSCNPNEYILQNIPERYVNHSCQPNTEVINNCDVAIKDINKDEEITSDYSKNNNLLIHFACSCKSKNCKKYI